MKLQSYRKKGINAYLAIVGGGIDLMDFGTPATPEDAEKAHQSRSHTVTIDLGTKTDGDYYYKEAQGYKSTQGWLRIKAGEIAEEWNSLIEYQKAVIVAPIANTESQSIALPDLEGSEKQISWAEQIRTKAISEAIIYHAALKIDDVFESKLTNDQIVLKFSKYKSAKWWIDRRDDFKAKCGWKQYV